MTVVVVADKASVESVRFGLSPLAELGSALHVLTAVEHGGSWWRARTWSGLSEAVKAECTFFAPCWGGYRSRLLLPRAFRFEASIECELRDLAGLPIAEVAEQMAYSLCGVRGRRDLSNVLTDVEIAEWVMVQARGRGAGGVADLLLRDPAGFRRRFVDLLVVCWETFFHGEWERHAPILLREVEKRRVLVGREGVLSALAGVSPAAVLAGPGRLELDKLNRAVIDVESAPLLVVPSVFGAPHLLVKPAHPGGWPAVLQYPLPLVEGQERVVPSPVLSRRLRVLADPMKARICRAIARHPRSTAELAECFGLSPSEMSRHLRVLRESGLASRYRAGHFVFYVLRLDEVARLGSDSVQALLR